MQSIKMASSMRRLFLATVILILAAPNLFPIVLSFQPSYQFYRNSLLRADTALFNYRGSKYVSPVMEDRLKRGLLTSADLDR